MYCINCRSPYILPINKLFLKATGTLSLNMDTINIRELYVDGVFVEENNQEDTLQFECRRCGNTLNLETEVVLNCWECGHLKTLPNLGYTESRKAPICDDCHKKYYSDEEYTQIDVSKLTLNTEIDK